MKSDYAPGRPFLGWVGAECLIFAKLKYIFIGFKDQVTLLNHPLIGGYSLKWVSLIIPVSQNLLL